MKMIGVAIKTIGVAIKTPGWQMAPIGLAVNYRPNVSPRVCLPSTTVMFVWLE
jgi:hypothetical protein